MLVDFYPEKWERGCHLALSAKEDFSDFPNTNLVKGRILEINKTSDGHAEIVFDKELETVVKTGTLVRIQSPIGASYMYPMEKQLEPGEVINLSSVVQKDDTCLAFNPKSFCKGTDYVVPCVFFESIKSGDKTTVLISDFTVSY